jgi:hypothetical protein
MLVSVAPRAPAERLPPSLFTSLEVKATTTTITTLHTRTSSLPLWSVCLPPSLFSLSRSLSLSLYSERHVLTVPPRTNNTARTHTRTHTRLTILTISFFLLWHLCFNTVAWSGKRTRDSAMARGSRNRAIWRLLFGHVCGALERVSIHSIKELLRTIKALLRLY